MTIVFFGSSEFSIPSLRQFLSSRHNVLSLVTQPDRKKGRSLKLLPTPTKILAGSHGIAVHQPEAASSPESIRHLQCLKPDIFVVVSFGQILKKELLGVPRLCSINLHASLLPRYRGAAPVNWAVINGETKTGVTVMRMNEKMDAGDIIATQELDIDEEDNALTVNERLADIGAKVLLDVIELIEKGLAIFRKQDETFATYAPKLKKEDGLIDWRKSAEEIHNRVRGLVPWPGAYTYYSGKVIKIIRTELETVPREGSVNNPGAVEEIVKGKGMTVGTGSGALMVTHLQLEGKKAFDTDAFLRGHRITKGTILGA